MNQRFMGLFILLGAVVLHSCASHEKTRTIEFARETYAKCRSIASASDKKYEMAEDQIRPVKSFAPQFPPAAARGYIFACAYIVFDINEQGQPNNMRLMIEEPSHRGIGVAALNALSNWEYPPTPVKNYGVQFDFVNSKYDKRFLQMQKEYDQQIQEASPD